MKHVCLSLCEEIADACGEEYFSFPSAVDLLEPCTDDSLICSPLKNIAATPTEVCRKLTPYPVDSKNKKCYSGSPVTTRGFMERGNDLASQLLNFMEWYDEFLSWLWQGITSRLPEMNNRIVLAYLIGILIGGIPFVMLFQNMRKSKVYASKQAASWQVKAQLDSRREQRAAYLKLQQTLNKHKKKPVVAKDGPNYDSDSSSDDE